MSAVVGLLQLAQLATRRLAQRRRHPTAKKPKIGQHRPAGQQPVQAALDKRPGVVHRPRRGIGHLYQQRGGPRRQTPGAHGRPILSDRDRLLVAVVYLRQVCSQQVLADLLGVTQPVIGPAVKQTRRLLAELQHTITPTALRLGSPRTSSTTPTPATPEPTRPGYAVISSWLIQP